MNTLAIPRPVFPSWRDLWLLAVAFTNVGAAIVTNRIIGSGTAGKNIGWGTSTTAAAVTDTALGTEVAPTTSGGRTVGTESRVTGSVTNDTYRVVGSVTQSVAGPVVIAEAGLFDNVTGGTMLVHAVFGGVSTVNGDTLNFTFDLKFLPSVT